MADSSNGRRSRFSKSTLPADSGNKFTNDGSFMEMFKKQMEENQREKDYANQKPSHEDKSQIKVSSPKSTTTLSLTSAAASSSSTPTTPTGISSTTSNSSKGGTSDALHASSSLDGADKLTLAQKKMNYSFFVGKRRGSAPVLKTGAVKKAKVVKDAAEGAGKTDAWSHYLAEVQKYKSQSCQDEDRTRPLVK